MKHYCAVYHTDEHFKRGVPQSRLDNYPLSILKKIEWCVNYSNEIGADIHLLGGDLFDKADQTPWEIYQMWQQLANIKAPIHAVTGNHPIKGNATKWRESSGFYILEKMLFGRMTIADDFKADIAVGNIVFRLHHTLIVREPFPFDDHHLWEEYDAGKANVVLISHYHPQQGIWQRSDGVWFVSPGALSRASLGEDNVNRKPALAVIKFTENKILNIELVDIPHQPAEEVINLNTYTKVEDNDRDEKMFDEFTNSIRNARDNPLELMTPEDLLKKVCSIRKAGPSVTKTCLEMLREKT